MSFGVVGYQDGQRIQNWDPGAVTWRDHMLVTGSQTSPVIPCYGYGYLYVFHHNVDTQATVVVNWSDDNGMVDLTGGREFAWDPLVLNAAEVIYRNLSQYAQVITAPSGGALANWHDNTLVMLTNHQPSPLSLADGQAMGSFGHNIPAAGSVTDVLDIMGGSPMQVYIEGGTQGVDVKLQYLSDLFTPVTFYHTTVAASTPANFSVGTPFAPLYCVLTNLSAANPCNGVVDTFIPYD